MKTKFLFITLLCLNILSQAQANDDSTIVTGKWDSPFTAEPAPEPELTIDEAASEATGEDENQTPSDEAQVVEPEVQEEMLDTDPSQPIANPEKEIPVNTEEQVEPEPSQEIAIPEVEPPMNTEEQMSPETEIPAEVKPAQAEKVATQDTKQKESPLDEIPLLESDKPKGFIYVQGQSSSSQFLSKLEISLPNLEIISAEDPVFKNEFPLQITLDEDSNVVSPSSYSFGTHTGMKSVDVHFSVPEQAEVSLKLLDPDGKVVVTLSKGKKKTAYYSVKWIPVNPVNGNYTVEFTAGKTVRKNLVNISSVEGDSYSLRSVEPGVR